MFFVLSADSGSPDQGPVRPEFIYTSADPLGAAPWVVWACLKCDQILKCFVAVVKINSFNWMKNLTRERN